MSTLHAKAPAASAQPKQRARAKDAPARRVMMIAPHFEEYAFRLSGALAIGATVMLQTDMDRLHRDYAGRTLTSIPRVQTRNARFRSPLDALRILVDVVKFRPSVIHIQEPSGMRKALICAFIVAVTRRFCRIKLTIHDPKPHEGRDHDIARRLDPYRRYIRRNAKSVFVHGEYCRDQYRLVRENENQPIVVIDHGEILADAPPTIRTGSPLSVLCFGRMEAYKGLDVLCSALCILDDDGVSPNVLVAGSGPELDRLMDEFAPLENVTVENAFVASDRLIDALRDSDCVVMPYLEATQSGVLAAAMANGRFVIASRVGGIPDIVEDMENGILVPPNDPAALADAIRKVADDPELRQRLAQGARRTAAERLKWDRIVPDMLSRY